MCDNDVFQGDIHQFNFVFSEEIQQTASVDNKIDVDRSLSVFHESYPLRNDYRNWIEDLEKQLISNTEIMSDNQPNTPEEIMDDKKSEPAMEEDPALNFATKIVSSIMTQNNLSSEFQIAGICKAVEIAKKGFYELKTTETILQDIYNAEIAIFPKPNSQDEPYSPSDTIETIDLTISDDEGPLDLSHTMPKLSLLSPDTSNTSLPAEENNKTETNNINNQNIYEDISDFESNHEEEITEKVEDIKKDDENENTKFERRIVDVTHFKNFNTRLVNHLLDQTVYGSYTEASAAMRRLQQITNTPSNAITVIHVGTNCMNCDYYNYQNQAYHNDYTDYSNHYNQNYSFHGEYNANMNYPDTMRNDSNGQYFYTNYDEHTRRANEENLPQPDYNNQFDNNEEEGNIESVSKFPEDHGEKDFKIEEDKIEEDELKEQELQEESHEEETPKYHILCNDETNVNENKDESGSENPGETSSLRMEEDDEMDEEDEMEGKDEMDEEDEMEGKDEMDEEDELEEKDEMDEEDEVEEKDVMEEEDGSEKEGKMEGEEHNTIEIENPQDEMKSLSPYNYTLEIEDKYNDDWNDNKESAKQEHPESDRWGEQGEQGWTTWDIEEPSLDDNAIECETENLGEIEEATNVNNDCNEENPSSEVDEKPEKNYNNAEICDDRGRSRRRSRGRGRGRGFGRKNNNTSNNDEMKSAEPPQKKKKSKKPQQMTRREITVAVEVPETTYITLGLRPRGIPLCFVHSGEFRIPIYDYDELQKVDNLINNYLKRIAIDINKR
nr:protein PFC0760c-like [Onthophagus taurus]